MFKSLFFSFWMVASAINFPVFGEPLAVYLTWQNHPESTMTIHWISKSDEIDSKVEYSLEKEGLKLQSNGSYVEMPGDPAFLVHQVSLKNLTPDSVYSFKVNSVTKDYKFRTMPSELTTPLSFVQGGDMYYKTLTYMEKLCRLAAAKNPHFALLGGDIADSTSHHGTDEVQHWLDWLITWEKNMVTPDGRLVPIVTAIGNHEVKGKFHKTPKEAAVFFTLFPMPQGQGYHVLDFGQYLSLFVLDSGHADEVDGPQADWLKEVLEKRTDIRHKFAVYHVPAFPGAVQKKKEPVGEQILSTWVPEFERYGLNVAFEHHEHAYKRTHPMRDGKVDPSGVVYLGEGGWGAEKLHDVHSEETLWYLAKAESARHFIYVELTPESRSYQAIDETGSIIDSFVDQISIN